MGFPYYFRNLHTRARFGLSAGLLGLVVALHLWLVWVGPLPGDRWSTTTAGPWAGWPWVVHAAGGVIQFICTAGPAIAIVATGLLLLMWRGGPGEAQGLVVACLAIPAAELAKKLLGPEPIWIAIYPGARSYPSVHVVFVTAAIGYLGLCARRHEMHRTTRLAVALVVWVGPERVLSGVHTVSDAIAGYLLAGSFLVLADMCPGSELLGRARVRRVLARRLVEPPPSGAAGEHEAHSADAGG